MHVIGGLYKGKSLQYPKSKGFRPSQSRVKEAVFNILSTRIDGAVFVDLCCGTGAVGIEAISRGAKEVHFVDLDVRWVRKNLADIQGEVSVWKRPWSRFLAQLSHPVDILFFDPPWNYSDDYPDLLKRLCDFDILAANGIAVLEHSRRVKLEVPDGLSSLKQYSYGDTVLSVVTKT